MKVAIIEEDSSYIERLRKAAEPYSWDIEFFNSSSDFGKAKLDQFDVIISDFNLSFINGRNLIKSISYKTSAQIFLMSGKNDSFAEEDIQNERIKGLIDKSNTENVIDHIKYADTKIRIKKLIEKEQNKLDDMMKSTNGYILEKRKVF